MLQLVLVLVLVTVLRRTLITNTHFREIKILYILTIFEIVVV